MFLQYFLVDSHILGEITWLLVNRSCDTVAIVPKLLKCCRYFGTLVYLWWSHRLYCIINDCMKYLYFYSEIILQRYFMFRTIRTYWIRLVSSIFIKPGFAHGWCSVNSWSFFYELLAVNQQSLTHWLKASH